MASLNARSEDIHCWRL